jgi:hypothetical protein
VTHRLTCFVLALACAGATGTTLAAGEAADGTRTAAGTAAATSDNAAPSAARRGNVLSLRKTPADAPSHAPVVDRFVRLASASDVAALFESFDAVPVQANGEAAIKHYLTSAVMPFFADADRLDGQMRVTEASFEDGSAGHMAYAYVVMKSGEIKPFVLAWRREASRLRVMDVQMGRCVAARHPVTTGRCERLP